MVVVRSLIELEDGHAVLEMMAGHKPCGLELREHAVHRCKPDILVGVKERAVDRLGGQMPCRAALEDLEDLEPRQRHLEARFAQVLALHAVLSGSHAGAPHAMRYHGAH